MLKKLANRSKEQGFTLVEILVAVSLLALVAVGVTATIISISSTAQQFTASSTTQNKGADAISTITRDISASTTVTKADDYSISLRTAEDNQNFDIDIFYWDPSDASTAPSGIPTAQLPDTGAIIEYRKLVGASTGNVNVLTLGYDKNRQNQVLFTYFDKDNKDLVTPLDSSALDLIKRVEYKFALKVANRNALIELASSAIPRSATQINNSTVSDGYGACLPTTVTGTLVPRTTVANLSWAQVNGATGYTIYRKNDKQAYNPMVLETIGSYTTTTYKDTTVAKGEKYTYFIITNCALGNSLKSNEVNLNVTPAAPEIINMNTKKNIEDVLGAVNESGTLYSSAATVGAPYTVARNLKNQISWSPVNGAESYKVYRDGSLVYSSDPSEPYFIDDDLTYGDIKSYTVIATIATVNGSGGDGDQSVSRSLISPPKASVFTATPDDNTSTNATYSINNLAVTSRAANTTGFTVKRITAQTATVNCASATAVPALSFTGNSVSDGIAQASVRWGSTTCYVLTGYNDAGNGPESNATALQMPGKFAVNSLQEPSVRAQLNSYYVLEEYIDNTFGGRFNSDYTIGWSAPAGKSSTSYSVIKTRVESGAGVVEPASQTFATNATSYGFANITPGSLYKFNVTAKSANGRERKTADITGVTRPTIPLESHSIIQGAGGDNFRRRVSVYRDVPNGLLTQVEAKTWYVNHGEPGYTGFGAAATYGDVFSGNSNGGGPTGGASRTYLSRWSWAGYSREVRWAGVVTSGCNSTCNAGGNWVDSAEQEPDYFAGHHAYYRAF